jgi:hypothetical protein
MGKYPTCIALGIALFVFLFFFPLSVHAQFGFQPQPVMQQSHQAVLSSAQGRFAFGQVSDSSDDKFMLDTFTGRLWRLGKRTDIGLCLTPVPYRSEAGEYSPLPEPIPDAESGKTKAK